MCQGVRSPDVLIMIEGLVAYVSGNHSVTEPLRTSLCAKTRRYERKRNGDLVAHDELKPVYDVIDKDTFRIGLNGLKRVSKQLYLLNDQGYNVDTVVNNREDFYFDNLPIPQLPYVLRDYQEEAFKALVGYRSGVVRLPTGSGKSEIFIAVAKSLYENYGYLTIVLEPTDVGEQTMLKRCKKYGIEAVSFRNRFDLTKDTVVMPTTPKILLNAIDINNLTSIESKKIAIISDECQHIPASSWHQVILSLNPVRNYGFSATPFSKYESLSASYLGMDYEDAVLDSVAGPLVFEEYASSPRIAKHLNDPILINFDIWEEKESVVGNDWSKLRHFSYQDDRMEVMANIVKHTDLLGLKSITFIHEKAQARRLMELIGSKNCMCWFGGGDCSTIYDKAAKSLEEICDLIERGIIRHIIATTHLDEVVDIPELDVCILQEWKMPRKSVQRAGRVLRKSESGASYIVNIWHSNSILRYHAKTRSNSLVEEYGKTPIVCHSLGEFKTAMNELKSPSID